MTDRISTSVEGPIVDAVRKAQADLRAAERAAVEAGAIGIGVFLHTITERRALDDAVAAWFDATTREVVVASQTYSDATGVPMWVTTFTDGYVGRYMAASARTCRELLTQGRYAAGTYAGEAIRYALARMGE